LISKGEITLIFQMFKKFIKAAKSETTTPSLTTQFIHSAMHAGKSQILYISSWNYLFRLLCWGKIWIGTTHWYVYVF